jgi:hypothetical protein
LAESPLSSPAGPRFLPQRLTLYAIVRHLCTDRLREKRRAPAMTCLAEVSVAEIPDESEQGAPLALLPQRERLDRIRTPLAMLSPSDREIITLSYERDLSSKEICVPDIRRGTVIRRGRTARPVITFAAPARLIHDATRSRRGTVRLEDGELVGQALTGRREALLHWWTATATCCARWPTTTSAVLRMPRDLPRHGAQGGSLVRGKQRLSPPASRIRLQMSEEGPPLLERADAGSDEVKACPPRPRV